VIWHPEEGEELLLYYGVAPDDNGQPHYHNGHKKLQDFHHKTRDVASFPTMNRTASNTEWSSSVSSNWFSDICLLERFVTILFVSVAAVDDTHNFISTRMIIHKRCDIIHLQIAHWCYMQEKKNSHITKKSQIVDQACRIFHQTSHRFVVFFTTLHCKNLTVQINELDILQLKAWLLIAP